MSTETEIISLPRDNDRDQINAETELTATGASDAIKFSPGSICCQITGSATAIVAQVQRSTRDPADTPNWAPAGPAITGNPSSGIQPVAYDEVAGAWWRVNVTSLTGVDTLVVLSGPLG